MFLPSLNKFITIGIFSCSARTTVHAGSRRTVVRRERLHLVLDAISPSTPHKQKNPRPRDESQRFTHCSRGTTLISVTAHSVRYNHTPVVVTTNDVGQVYSSHQLFRLAAPEGFSTSFAHPAHTLPGLSERYLSPTLFHQSLYKTSSVLNCRYYITKGRRCQTQQKPKMILIKSLV